MEFIGAFADVIMPALPVLIPVMGLFTRLSVFMFLVPVFGEVSVSMRIRLALAFVFTVLLLPILSLPNYSEAGMGAGAALVASEALIGFVFGMALRLMIHVLQLAGHIVSQAMSISQVLGEGITTEPNTTVSTLLTLSGLTLLVSLDIHIELLGLFYASFSNFPIGAAISTGASAELLSQQAMTVFSFSLSLAFPFVLLNLLYNLVLGFVNRAMPQLLVSFVGMPAMTGIGIIFLAGAAGAIVSLWMQGFLDLTNSLRALNG